MPNIFLDLALVNMNLNNKVRTGIKDDFNKIRTLETPYGELGHIIYHLFEAVHIWLNRITNNYLEIKSYNELSEQNEFFNIWKSIDKRFISYTENIGSSFDYNKIIIFNKKSGDVLQMLLGDILMHISHHSFYHRGQIATLLRINNFIALPDLDWSKN
jgi:uncharacterized damage-inducible protein DinB